MAAPLAPNPIAAGDRSVPRRISVVGTDVYHRLLRVSDARQASGTAAPHVVVITDLAKDYDDLLAMVLLKELHRLGLVILEGFIANLHPAASRARFGRGALDSLGLPHIPIAVGTAGSDRKPPEYDYEFHCNFMAPENTPLEEGGTLLFRLFTRAVQERRRLTLLLISSLKDVNEFAVAHPRLFRAGISNVVLQGGYEMIEGVLTPRVDAANNAFDMDAARNFHTFLQQNNIPTVCYTKITATITTMSTQIFVDMDATAHPIGTHLRTVERAQDVVFYARACSDQPFAPHMNRDWFLRGKSSFYTRHPANPGSDVPIDGTPFPVGDQIIPYLTQIVAYDALAALHTAGEDVVTALHIMDPESGVPNDADIYKRPYANQPTIHKLLGWAQPRPNPQNLPNIPHVHPVQLANAVEALLKGSIFNTVDRLSALDRFALQWFGSGSRASVSFHDTVIIICVISLTVALYAVLSEVLGVRNRDRQLFD